MSDPEHFIEARPPPPPDPIAKFLKQWGLAVVILGLAGLFAYKSYENWRLNQALAADNVIKFGGLAFSVHDLEVRPVDAIFALHATLRPLDLQPDRSMSVHSILSEACTAILASGMVGVDPKSVFRVTLELDDREDRLWGTAPVSVSDGNCLIHMQDDMIMYTMPDPLNGWVLNNWRAKPNLLADDLLMEISFGPRGDADPDLADFDHFFACRVLLADWPMSLPQEVAGRTVTDVAIEARFGKAGSLLSFGRYSTRTFSLVDGDCEGEGA